MQAAHDGIEKREQVTDDHVIIKQNAVVMGVESSEVAQMAPMIWRHLGPVDSLG
jgi:hypothetical protein